MRVSLILSRLNIARVVVLVLAFSLAGVGLAASRRGESLHYLLKVKQPICVHLGEFINSSGSDRINMEEFREAIGEAFKTRMDMDFKVVDNPEEADISVSGEIKKYTYSKEDPIDMLVGIWGTALDALSTQNYVGLAVNYTVRKPKNDRILWSKRLRPSVTKSDMPQDESTPLIVKEAARQFVSQCFRRPRRR